MFANPAFLWALAAAATPVLVHLIFRRKRTAVEFPTLMFLRRVDMKLASRRKLKELLLLLLRVLAIACVALALARPGFTQQGAQSLGAAADCVLILDNSASMSLPTPAGTRLEAARTRAAAVLETLSPESRAAVLTLVGGEEGAEAPAFTADLVKLRATLQAIEPAAGAGRLAGALARAGELLAQTSSAPNREVYLFTDLQRAGLDDPEALRNAAALLPDSTALFLAPAPSGAPRRNLALAELVIDPRPKVTGRALTLVAKVHNPGGEELTTQVTAQLGDAPAVSVPAAVPPGQTLDVPLRFTLGAEGFASGTVTLDADDAPFDNAWPFCLQVRGPLRVLVLSRGGETEEQRDEAFYVRKALDPTGDGRLSGLRVEYLAQEQAPRAGLEAYDAVVVCGATALPPEALAALDAYVRKGGGLLYFGGARDVQLGAQHPLHGLLPAQAAAPMQVPPQGEPYTLRVTRPATACFDDVRAADGRVPFDRVAVLRAIEAKPAPGATVLAEFSNGAPALLERAAGAGRVQMWALSAHAEDTNLPLQPGFLALLHRSLVLLSGAEAPVLRAKAGLPVTLDLAPFAKRAALPPVLALHDPKQRRHAVALAESRLVWRATAQAGVYRLEPPEGADGAFPQGFVVTPDPAESGADYLAPDDALAALGFARAQVLGADADLAAVLAQTRSGRELFGALILAALLALLAEAFLANQTGGRRKPLGEAEALRGPPNASPPSSLNLEPAAPRSARKEAAK
ncbi:MAG: BatA domain-containing protein [Planctomycetes bacterium]|nr:BatA domain-containing protein [Planctomycetota bacterium]